RGAGDLPLAEDVDRLPLGLVREPLLDLGEDLEDLVGAGTGRAVARVLCPLRAADGLRCALPVLLLQGEVDVGVGVGLPALALHHPARLAAAAGVAAARHRLAELAVRPLRVLLKDT